ncbi:MAG: SBBP repeat-containing protein [Ignavibacteria bacterium]
MKVFSWRTKLADIKIYNSNGELVWKQFELDKGNRSDVPASIALDKNNNVYVTGYGYVSHLRF